MKFPTFVNNYLNMKPHKKLNSWIKSFEFVKEIYLATRQFPSEEKFGITSQIRRAGTDEIFPIPFVELTGTKLKQNPNYQ